MKRVCEIKSIEDLNELDIDDFKDWVLDILYETYYEQAHDVAISMLIDLIGGGMDASMINDKITALINKNSMAD